MSTKLMSKSMAVILAVLITAVFAISSQQAFGKDDPNAKSPKVEKEQPKGHGDMQEGINKRMEHLTKELNLTKEQQEKIKPILENEMKEMRTIREDSSLTPEQKHEKTKAIRQTTKEAINKILTPEQQKKYAEMQENAREKMGERRGEGNKNHKHGPEDSNSK
jgi:protein CpxP